jgi:hypothetical protein
MREVSPIYIVTLRTCKGIYNIFAGAAKAVFDVEETLRPSDGRSTVNIVTCFTSWSFAGSHRCGAIFGRQQGMNQSFAQIGVSSVCQKRRRWKDVTGDGIRIDHAEILLNDFADPYIQGMICED